jgi:predicted DsbA family dithiol-disulfide isomerase
VVESIGLGRDLAERVLVDEMYVEAVRDSQQQWQNQNIRAVPAFIFNNRYLLSGAQPVETLLQVINECTNGAS